MKKGIILLGLLACLGLSNVNAVPHLETTRFVQGNWWLEVNVDLIEPPDFSYAWFYVDDTLAGHGTGILGIGWRGYLSLTHPMSSPGEHIVKAILNFEEDDDVVLFSDPYTVLMPTGEKPEGQKPIPTPDSGATALMLAGGFCGLLALRRQFALPLWR